MASSIISFICTIRYVFQRFIYIYLYFMYTPSIFFDHVVPTVQWEQLIGVITSYLLIHNAGQLPGQVSVAGLHLVVILLLVLFDQSLVYYKCLTTGVHKMPEDRGKAECKAANCVVCKPVTGAVVGWTGFYLSIGTRPQWNTGLEPNLVSGPHLYPKAKCEEQKVFDIVWGLGSPAVPEDLFQLFDLVVGVFLSTAVVQEGSGISKRTSVYLDDSDDDGRHLEFLN